MLFSCCLSARTHLAELKQEVQMKAATGKKLGVKFCDVEDVKAVMLHQGLLS